MKKTKKLDLTNLKVESFVTSIEKEQINTVKGGSSAGCVVVLTATLTIAAGSAAVSAVVSYYTAKNNKLCDTAAYCGNTHDGGNGCSGEICG